MIHYTILSVYVQPFSAGYYVTEMHVFWGDNEPATINTDDYHLLYALVHDQYMADDDANRDITLKIQSTQFPVEPSDDTPEQVLELPTEIADSLTVPRQGARQPTLVPHADTPTPL